jgi:hypothetical protein
VTFVSTCPLIVIVWPARKSGTIRYKGAHSPIFLQSAPRLIRPEYTYDHRPDTIRSNYRDKRKCPYISSSPSSICTRMLVFIRCAFSKNDYRLRQDNNANSFLCKICGLSDSNLWVIPDQPGPATFDLVSDATILVSACHHAAREVSSRFSMRIPVCSVGLVSPSIAHSEHRVRIPECQYEMEFLLLSIQMN